MPTAVVLIVVKPLVGTSVDVQRALSWRLLPREHRVGLSSFEPGCIEAIHHGQAEQASPPHLA